METPSAAPPRPCKYPGTPAHGVLIKKVGLLLLLISCTAFTQDLPALGHKGTLDLSVWVSGETGEELTNSYTESQIFSAAAFAGWQITREHGSGWRRGSLEYAFDFMPVFETFATQRTHGWGFDPVILRWKLCSAFISHFALHRISGRGSQHANESASRQHFQL